MKLFLFIFAIAGCTGLPSNWHETRMASIYPRFANMSGLVQGGQSTDCHGWDWFYCPRDPGCSGYAMSVHQVSIGKLGQQKIEEGKWVNLYAIGMTTLKSVPEHATFKVYGIDGSNIAGGPLQARGGVWNDKTKGASLELNYDKKPGQFRLQIPVIVASKDFDDYTGTQMVNFGIDVFLAAGQTHEGMCVQVGNPAYSKAVATKTDPAFEMICKDNGDGTFTPGTVPNVLHPLKGCNEFGKECDGCMVTCNPQRATALVDRNPFILH